MENIKRQNCEDSKSERTLRFYIPEDVYILYSLYCWKLNVTRKSFFLSLFNSYVTAHPDPSLEALVKKIRKV